MRNACGMHGIYSSAALHFSFHFILLSVFEDIIFIIFYLLSFTLACMKKKKLSWTVSYINITTLLTEAYEG